LLPDYCADLVVEFENRQHFAQTIGWNPNIILDIEHELVVGRNEIRQILVNCIVDDQWWRRVDDYLMGRKNLNLVLQHRMEFGVASVVVPDDVEILSWVLQVRNTLVVGVKAVPLTGEWRGESYH
jgi:hypothetical protein